MHASTTSIKPGICCDAATSTKEWNQQHVLRLTFFHCNGNFHQSTMANMHGNPNYIMDEQQITHSEKFMMWEFHKQILLGRW